MLPASPPGHLSLSTAVLAILLSLLLFGHELPRCECLSQRLCLAFQNSPSCSACVPPPAPRELPSVLFPSVEARGAQAPSSCEVTEPGPGLPHCRAGPTSAGTVGTNQDHALLGLLSFHPVLRMMFGFYVKVKGNISGKEMLGAAE